MRSASSKTFIRGFLLNVMSALYTCFVLAWSNPMLAQGKETSTTGSPWVKQPNFLIILADDMGWSDIGVFGGEIRTPNIDALAAEGMSMSQFYVAPVCAPTRAMLLTGVDSHAAGVGALDGLQAPNQQGSLNYAAQLHDGVVTVAEGLSVAGYRTYMTGKWHLAVDAEQQPQQRGFDRSYVLLQGGASHFADRRSLGKGGTVDYLEDGHPVDLPNDFYSSIAYTDKLLEYLQDRRQDAPFFAYLAYTAPHDPLQVPDSWLEKYRGQYDEGPVSIRERRAAGLRASGLFPQSADIWQHSGYPPWLPIHKKPWAERSPQQRLRDTRTMEIYAAMIELMDQQIGRVIDYLKDSGELENTYVIFLSDNGANGTSPLVYPGNTREWFLDSHDQSLDNMGKPGSYTFLDLEWAMAAVSPWKLYKATVGEGGIRAPLIVRGPGVPAGEISDAIAQVTDITPTIYTLAEISGAIEPLYEEKILPQGISLAPLWTQSSSTDDRLVISEFRGSRAVRRERWKASHIRPPIGSGRWELYDMVSDPGEVLDVAQQHPEILKELVSDYAVYVEKNGVIHPQPEMEADLSVLYAGECDWWCEVRFTLTNTVARFIIHIRALLQP